MELPFRKDLEKYKDLDEDEILGKLSEEELKQLESVLDDLDPENALLPAGFRQKDQTVKKPSGPFDREKLLAYLEKQALEHKDREDVVPFTGEKKGLAGSKPRLSTPLIESLKQWNPLIIQK
ncbi:UNVERIFIED_CONTAM: Tropomodulin-3 [Gekko kuhli]